MKSLKPQIGIVIFPLIFHIFGLIVSKHLLFMLGTLTTKRILRIYYIWIFVVQIALDLEQNLNLSPTLYFDSHLCQMLRI